MEIKFEIKQKETGQWSDPMMKYIQDYLQELTQDCYGDFFKDMNCLFQFIQNLNEEFTSANPQYRRPSGFSITYDRPSCCMPSITVNYIHEYIIIREKLPIPIIHQ